MGRKRIEEDTKTAEYYEAERRRQEELQVQRQQDARRKLIEPYTDGLPYNRDRVIVVARDHLCSAYSNAIECGKCLIWLQAEEGVQTFGQILNQYFPNISRATAYNFMKLAKVTMEHPKMQYFVEKYRSKVIALLEILNEEDIETLEDGGEIAGMTLDDVEKMPARQLKDELRAYKKKADRGKEQLQEAEDKIKGLEQEIQNIKTPKIFDTEEEKYIDIVREIGWKFEYILFDIKTKLPFDRESLPEAALKRLLYLLVYMSRETLNERLRLCQHYDGAAEDIPWEPSDMELPPAEQLEEGTPHVKEIMAMVQKHLEKRKQRKEQAGDGV